jgi:DNA-binding PadR family transcriptional regulator
VHANIDTWNYEAQELEGAVRGLHGHAEASAEDARWWFLEKLLTGKDPIKSSAMRRFFPDAQRGPLLESLESDGLVIFEQDAFALTDAGRAKLQRHLKFNGTLVTTRPYYVHVGPIASGNAIMADGAIWTNLPGQRKTLAVEMEAAALGELAHQHKLPFAIAKGVMDHADKHKTDRFKNFAARASAEVLCHFLRRALSPPEAAALMYRNRRR